MAVDHRKVVVVVLLGDKSSRVLAECTHLVLERRRVAHELGLVEHLVDFLHDLVADLDAHADVNGAGLVGDVVARAQLLKPLRAAAPRGHNHAVRLVLRASAGQIDHNALAHAVVDDQILARAAEDHLNAVLLQKMLQLLIKLLRLLRAEMADRAVHKLQSRLDRAPADLLHLVGLTDALHMCVRAEGQIHRIRVIDQRLRGVRSDQLRKITADLVAQG